LLRVHLAEAAVDGVCRQAVPWPCALSLRCGACKDGIRTLLRVHAVCC
jgi:hypothetical protein